MTEAIIVLNKSSELSYNISKTQQSTIIIIHVPSNMIIPFDEFAGVLANVQTCEIHWSFREIPEITKKFHSMVNTKSIVQKMIDIEAPTIVPIQKRDVSTNKIRRWAQQVISHMENNGAHPDFQSKNSKTQKKCINYISSVLGEPIDIAMLAQIHECICDHYSE